LFGDAERLRTETFDRVKMCPASAILKDEWPTTRLLQKIVKRSWSFSLLRPVVLFDVVDG